MSSGSGWVATGPAESGNECTRLYWTDDDGQTWRDITPLEMPTRSIGQVFFLDRSHGWMLSTDALGNEQSARFYLLATEDAGKHWRTLMLQRPMFKLMDEWNFPTQLFFFDSQHGWMLWHWHFMNSSRDALLRTIDGGRTWDRLPDLPGPGPLQFTSARDGWMIGGPEEPGGIGAPDDTQLWITHDGGTRWRSVAVPVSKDSAEQAHLIALKFKNMREGQVAAHVAPFTIRGDETTNFVNCSTRDAGKAWRCSRFKARSAVPSIGDTHIYWSVFNPDPDRTDALQASSGIQEEDRPVSVVLPAGISPGSLDDLDFLDDTNGWVSYIDTKRQTMLMATMDGGRTFKLMQPPLPVQPSSTY